MKRVFKTTKQLSGKPLTFRAWDDYEVGDVIVCKYVKTTPNKFNEDKPNHVVEIIEAFLKDKKMQAKLSEGVHLVFNTIGMLDKALEDINPGDCFQVTYNGKATIETGKFKGKEAHTVEVVMVSEESEDEEQDDL